LFFSWAVPPGVPGAIIKEKEKIMKIRGGGERREKGKRQK
jgi:hypothetical protein